MADAATLIACRDVIAVELWTGLYLPASRFQKNIRRQGMASDRPRLLCLAQVTSLTRLRQLIPGSD